MSSEFHDSIVTLARTPISQASPAGDPVRYEPEFETLQAEIDKLSRPSLEQGKSQDVPDWSRVVELSTSILKSKSKDLLVMTYLTLGLFEQRGYGGLAAGLAAYDEFLKAFWEPCFPKIKPPHGRFNAVQYLIDRVLPDVEIKGDQPARAPSANEKEAVHKCADTLDALSETVSKAFADQPPDYSPNLPPLVRAFRALKDKVGPLKVDAPPAAAEGVPAVSAGAAPSAAPAASGAPAAPETFTTATQAVNTVVKVAKYLLTQDNKDARGYRLMRAVHFGGLAALPPNESGQTKIPPPPAASKQPRSLDNLLSTGDFPGLLTEAEGHFATTPLWLDLQRYAAQALAGMGPLYRAAHEAVVLEAVALRRRLPDVFDLLFADKKTPFADGATKSWVDEAASQFGGGGGGGGGGGDSVEAAIGEARKLLAEAKGPDAVNRMAALMDSAAGGRDRFRAQAALASFCMDMGKLPLATSLLEDLEARIAEYRLEFWEPQLSARALGDLFACLTKARPKPTPDEARRQCEVFARLCRVDPGAALKLEPPVVPAK